MFQLYDLRVSGVISCDTRYLVDGNGFERPPCSRPTWKRASQPKSSCNDFYQRIYSSHCIEHRFAQAYDLHGRRLQRRFSGSVIDNGCLTPHRGIVQRLRSQFSRDNFRGCCFRAIESVFAWSYLQKGIPERLASCQQAMRERITRHCSRMPRTQKECARGVRIQIFRARHQPVG
jgi:hypothetical protein